MAAIIGLNYVIAPQRRYLFLLISSLILIAAYSFPSLLVLLLLAFLNYRLALLIQQKGNYGWYTIGLIMNIAAILLFNYFTGSATALKIEWSEIHFNAAAFILALGLSFYSIQHLAYLHDVYKRRILAEHDFLRLLCAVAFFPKISCGPVYPVQEMLPVLNHITVNKQQVQSGLKRFLLGLAKKIILADRLAPSVASVFDYESVYPGITNLLAATLFSLQLYFDFSGYSDMAVGTAAMLGISIRENFLLPLRSASVSEFWRRWHISLIHFFTTYIYYPFSYYWRKKGQWVTYAGIAITFVVSGIWHGIGATFLAWALCHVLYLWLELLTKKQRTLLVQKYAVFHFAGIGVTFLLVSLSNIFFRSESFSQASSVLKTLFTHFLPANWYADVFAPLAVGGQQTEYFNFIFSLLLAFLYLLCERKTEQWVKSDKHHLLYYFVVGLVLMLFGVFNAGERFIYMQF